MLIKRQVYILNLGDSRSVIFRELKNEKFAIEISNDHNPLEKSERFRVY